MSNGFVFVLMPFKESFDDVYQLGIKGACNELGFYCERADEQIYQGSILDRIYNQIEKADYLVADLSQQNPNVFYEVGYAHALNKKVILIIDDRKDIPFDMQSYQIQIYDKGHIADLKGKIKENLVWYLNNPESVSQLPRPPFDLYINDDLIPFEHSCQYPIDAYWKTKTNGVTEYKLGFHIAVHNPTNKYYRLDKEFDMILPSMFGIDNDSTYIESGIIPNGMQKLSFIHDTDFFPDLWATQFVPLAFDDDEFSRPLDSYFGVHPIQINLYFQNHTYKYQFHLKVEKGLQEMIF